MRVCTFCLFFFFFQSSCMEICEKIPLEMIRYIESYLDDKSHMRFISTCKKFRSMYLSPSDYTEKMFQCARSYVLEQDEEKKKRHKEIFNGLMGQEGPINKLNRLSIENFFDNQGLKDLTTIEKYGRVYNEKNIFFNLQNGIAVNVYSPEVFELFFKQDNRHHFNYLGEFGGTALSDAVFCNKTERVKALLKLSSSLVNRKIQIKYHGPILIYAVLRSYGDIVKLLLSDLEIDINAQDFLGRTALHIAVEKNNIECVKLLINYPKINCTIRSNNYRNPYSYAKTPEIKELLSMRMSFWNKLCNNPFKLIINSFIIGCGIFFAIIPEISLTTRLGGIVIWGLVKLFFDKIE